jgi:hypothetical protein
MRPAHGRPLEAHEPADESVVARVGTVAVRVSEEAVEASFGGGERFDVQTETPKTWRADRDEKGLDGLDARGEISKTLFD